jgi:hypothetical protein
MMLFARILTRDFREGRKAKLGQEGVQNALGYDECLSECFPSGCDGMIKLKAANKQLSS